LDKSIRYGRLKVEGSENVEGLTKEETQKVHHAAHQARGLVERIKDDFGRLYRRFTWRYDALNSRGLKADALNVARLWGNVIRVMEDVHVLECCKLNKNANMSLADLKAAAEADHEQAQFVAVAVVVNNDRRPSPPPPAEVQLMDMKQSEEPVGMVFIAGQ
jgi:uncharacterized membrane-anchored protein